LPHPAADQARYPIQVGEHTKG